MASYAASLAAAAMHSGDRDADRGRMEAGFGPSRAEQMEREKDLTGGDVAVGE